MQILIYVMLAWGLNIVVGLAGLLDLGYVAFYAVGAYTYAIIAAYVIPATLPALGLWAFWICLPLAGLLAALWGVILGFPVLRLRGDYLAIVTLAFGEIIRLVLINWVALTNGAFGIQIAAHYLLRAAVHRSQRRDNGFAACSDFQQPDRPPLDLSLLHDPGARAARRLRHAAHAAAARRARLGGAARGRDRVPLARPQHRQHQAHRLRHGRAVRWACRRVLRRAPGLRQPQVVRVPRKSATILAIVVLGGMGSLVGVAVAAVVVIGGIELLRELDWMKSIFGDDFDPGQYRMLIFGLAMVIDDDLAPARAHVLARALDLAQ